MRRRVAVVVATMALMMVTMVPVALADQRGPCNDGGDTTGVFTGRNYAQHHIVAFAKIGGLGNDAHKPGSHMGFSFCDPSG